MDESRDEQGGTERMRRRRTWAGRELKKRAMRGTCERSPTKARFETIGQANRAARVATDRRALVDATSFSSYLCPSCKGYHLTTKGG